MRVFFYRLRADTCSEASIPLCICGDASQEGGIEHTITAGGCDSEPPRQKTEAIRRQRARVGTLLDALMCERDVGLLSYIQISLMAVGGLLGINKSQAHYLPKRRNFLKINKVWHENTPVYSHS